MGKTACVGSSHHASRPKLFNCCHARPCKLIIACCIFISFDKLPTNGSCIFVKEEIWNIDLRAIFFTFPFPVSVVNFSVWRTQSYLIAFYLNTGMEKDWLDLIGSKGPIILKK